MKIDLIAGARPNFMKIAPIIRAIENLKSDIIKYRLIHTGQHFDHAMSGSFFDELEIPRPHVNLQAKGGNHGAQTGAIMAKYEELLLKEPIDMCLVVGDVNSTMACAVTAKKLLVKVAHVEAGIRSGDLTMPEEINRLVTDSISDVFFTTTQDANGNLLREGHNANNIKLVGNTMIDTLLRSLPKLKRPKFFSTFHLNEHKYFVLTLHRPGNVDDPEKLKRFFERILQGAGEVPVVFPVHPRTRNVINHHQLTPRGLYLVDPMSYFEFNYLVKHSLGVITDSGGITEETTVMNIPCITLRDNTERPETCVIGTNELIGTNPNVIPFYLEKMKNGTWKRGGIPPLWDGNAADRIVEHLIQSAINI